MKKEIYLGAATGNVEFLKEARVKDVEAAVAVYSDDDLQGLTSRGNNIIHVAAEHGHLDFIKMALECFDATHQGKLISATNNDGDTPLHLAAKLHTCAVAQHLTAVSHCSCPWKVQNNKGNTPLHLALMNGGKSIQVAAYLLEVGPEVASYANHRKETPLHLAVNYDNQGAKTSMTNIMNKLNGLGASLDYTKSLYEEDSLSVIRQLLENTTTVCCLRDEDGMTPLLRATLKSYGPAVEAIINYCPESVEICDLRGKNVLHHLKLPTFVEAMKILRTPGIPVLMDRQDEEGNTPLHIAIMNYDYNMVKAMIECNANFAIENKEGTSPATLIRSDSSSFLDKTKDDIRRSNNIKDEVMPKELFEAAYTGKWQDLLERLKEPAYDKQFLSRLPDGTNILHVALQYCSFNYSSEQKELIVEAPKKYPILICQTDYRGCTPLHCVMSCKVLMPGGGRAMVDVLRQIKDQRSCFPLPPWEAKDLYGDTPLHLAIKYYKYELAKSLIELDAKLVGETNYSNETPLHYLCRYGESREMVDVLIEKDASVVYSYDADGFTPLLRAVQSPRSIKKAKRIIDRCPQSIKQVDSHFGRNVFHLMDLDPRFVSGRKFMKLPQMKNLLSQVDSQGNLPLHLALQQRRFRTAKLLVEQHLALRDYSIYYIENNDGKTCFEELSTIEDVPRWFQEFLSSELPDDQRRGLYLVGKSLYGVHYSKMKDFMGTLGVVAALLATITFTAAFTVPGGYDQEKGTPLLAKHLAFQVFMFADVVGMCSSVMALFGIIWFFTSDDIKDEGSELGDLSMGLLQLSFYATLVAFMTGVYVTTFPQVHSRWLAIFTCFICSLVLLLTKKHLMVKYLIGVFYCLAVVANAFQILLIHCAKRVACCLKSKNQANNL